MEAQTTNQELSSKVVNLLSRAKTGEDPTILWNELTQLKIPDFNPEKENTRKGVIKVASDVLRHLCEGN